MNQRVAARTRLNRSTQRRCDKKKFRKISVPCIALALLSQGCSQTAQSDKEPNYNRSFPHSESAPYSNAYFPPGYLISPNPPVPAPSDEYCRDVGAVPASSPVTGLPQSSNTEVIPSTNQITLNDRAPYDRCAIEYANNARAEYLRAGSVYSSTPGVLASILIPVGGAAVALGIEGVASGVVTGLGVGGASLLGMGTFYQHKDREQVYNTGANAIDCLLGTMQPFTNVSDDTLDLLAQDLVELSVAKAELERAMSAYQNLHIYDDCSKDEKVRKDAATLLGAAQTVDKAAQSGLQAGIDFNSSTLAAPATIVYSVYSINDGIIKGLINTEPDVQTLAGNLKGVIPDSANNLAGIKQAQSATSQSAAAMSDAKQPVAVQSVAPTIASAKSATVTAQNATATAQNASATAESATVTAENVTATAKGATFAAQNLTTNAEHLNATAKNLTTTAKNLTTTAQDLTTTAQQAAASAAVRAGVPQEQVDLYSSMFWVNSSLFRVSSILGSATKPPDTKACVQLTAQAKEPKVLTLKPSGQIPVTSGSKTTITVKGVTTKPEVFPLFPQDPSLKSDVTASISDNQIEISAEEGTSEKLYPFVLMDGAIGETFQVKVTKKAPDQFGNTCKPAKTTRTKKVKILTHSRKVS